MVCLLQHEQQHLGNICYAVGGTTIIKPSPEVARLLGTADCVPAFYRLLSADNQLFYASQYDRVKKRNSYIPLDLQMKMNVHLRLDKSNILP